MSQILTCMDCEHFKEREDVFKGVGRCTDPNSPYKNVSLYQQRCSCFNQSHKSKMRQRFMDLAK